MPDASTIDDQKLARLLAVEDIRGVVYRYCRGVDRRQYDLVRSCYHPDAVDHHGMYVGPVDGFVEQLQAGIGAYERTTHFIGNVAVDLDGTRARAESYLVAYHRLPADADGVARDFVIGGRYVDDFEERHGEWRIATRICVVDWARLDVVGDGRPGGDDPVFAPSLGELANPRKRAEHR
jgi:hypothetical protein